MSYVIIHKTDDGLFWSNEYGWTGLNFADRFSESETFELHLPLDGSWVKLEEISKHSSAPWVATEWQIPETSIHDADGCWIAIMTDNRCHNDAPPLQVSYANTRLILRAPEMAQACKKALQTLCDVRDAWHIAGGKGEFPGQEVVDELTKVLVEAGQL